MNGPVWKNLTGLSPVLGRIRAKTEINASLFSIGWRLVVVLVEKWFNVHINSPKPVER